MHSRHKVQAPWGTCEWVFYQQPLPSYASSISSCKVAQLSTGHTTTQRNRHGVLHMQQQQQQHRRQCNNQV